MEEWRRGWPIVLGCALGSGTGAALLFFTFSLFVLPIERELGLSRGEMASVQALIVAGALGSPIIGRLTDRFGFRPVYVGCILTVIAIELAIATIVDDLIGMAVAVFLIGLIGVGTTALTVTRPVNAWFDEQRGLALGLAACGTGAALLVTPPLLEAVIAAEGWRAGFLALAGLAALVGLPSVLLLVRESPPEPDMPLPVPAVPVDRSFLTEGGFWLMALSLIAMSIAGAGFIGQLSPMVQGEGLSAEIAALAVSAFAAGQLTGRVAGGWCLDRFDPRRVAVLLNLVPAIGFVLLFAIDGSAASALAAALLIGFQQGAEIDIFAYFTARRYPLARYGTVYGALLGLSWIGNATGVIGVGWLHDLQGDYALAQLLGAAALAFGALLIAGVRLPKRDHHRVRT